MDKGGNKVQNLGFIIDKNGIVTYFGSWVEYDKREKENRNQQHTTSFEDEVEPTEYFKSLNLVYKKENDHWIIYEAENISLQGVIVGINNTYYKDRQELWMFVSMDLTAAQKESLNDLYETLKKFKTIKIKTSSKLGFNIEGYEYTSVDDYFEDYGIDLPGRKM